jgi:hypothetical protein
MNLQTVVLLLTAFSGIVKKGFGQDGVEDTAFEVDKEERALCNSDVGKDCASFEYCDEKPDAVLEQCVHCANEKAATFGITTTRSLCVRCFLDSTGNDSARIEGALDFVSGFQKHMSDLDVACSDSELSSYEGNSDREDPKGGHSTKENPVEVDSTDACACQGPCQSGDILSISRCGKGGSCQVSESCTQNTFTDPTVNYFAPPVPTFLCC